MNQTDPRVVGSCDGVPFRVHPGQACPSLRNADPAHKQPSMVRDAQVRIFDLSDATQLQEYQQVWDAIAKGLAVYSAEERQFCEDTQNWRVFLRWANLFYERPKGTMIHDGTSYIYTGSSVGV